MTHIYNLKGTQFVRHKRGLAENKKGIVGCLLIAVSVLLFVWSLSQLDFLSRLCSQFLGFYRLAPIRSTDTYFEYHMYTCSVISTYEVK